MKRCLMAALAALIIFSGILGPNAQADDAPSSVLFENVRVFNGTSGRLSSPVNVLIVGNTIQSISTLPITVSSGTSLTRIQAGGRTLMPGLIDAHVHLMFSNVSQAVILMGDIGYVNLAAGKAAHEMLMRGFTSVRDLGGPVFGLKRAIDEGLWQDRASGRPVRSFHRQAAMVISGCRRTFRLALATTPMANASARLLLPIALMRCASGCVNS